MVKAGRVGLELLDDEVRQLISADMKIFPVDYSFIEVGLNPNNYEFVRVISEGQFKNHIFVWDDSWKLIGADDIDVPWGNVKDKPTEFKPSNHTHLIAEITGLLDELNTIIEAINQKVDKVTGKVLSTNDFTDDLKLKLESLGGSASMDYTEMANRLQTHEEDSIVHVNTAEKTAIGTIGQKADKNYVDTELAKKAESSTLSGHTSNSTVHVTESDKDRWNTVEIEIGTTQPTSKIWYEVI